MKGVFIFFLLALAIAWPAESFAATIDARTLAARLDDVFRRALGLREQIRELAYAEPERKQVILQVGHWHMENVPWELQNLNPHRQAAGGGKMEWEVNLAIAQKTKELLEEQGITAELMPAILPKVYVADAFVAIHADQNPSMPWLSGFKVAPSAFDRSGKAGILADLLWQEYRGATWLRAESYIPDSMPGYYAFNSQKFIHAIHPKTPSAIIEVGYLPNPRDRAVILTNPQMSAQGIANAIAKFLALKEP